MKAGTISQSGFFSPHPIILTGLSGPLICSASISDTCLRGLSQVTQQGQPKGIFSSAFPKPILDSAIRSPRRYSEFGGILYFHFVVVGFFFTCPDICVCHVTGWCGLPLSDPSLEGQFMLQRTTAQSCGESGH